VSVAPPDRPFEDIIRDFGPMIRRIALTYESRGDLADELVQEIYLAIWRALPSFRGRAALRTFVARIATNRAVTHLARKMKVPRSIELDDEILSHGNTPEHEAIARDRRAILTAALHRLPLTYRQPVALVLEGLTLDEVAQVLGISTNAVGVRVSRAKQMLRQLIEGGPS
jgi:RNA polymerase sigma-70 factor (ECF subfamily)